MVQICCEYLEGNDDLVLYFSHLRVGRMNQQEHGIQCSYMNALGTVKLIFDLESPGFVVQI